jgi:predicted  nucleic acid-binding Zn-ribbon protein
MNNNGTGIITSTSIIGTSCVDGDCEVAPTSDSITSISHLDELGYNNKAPCNDVREQDVYYDYVAAAAESLMIDYCDYVLFDIVETNEAEHASMSSDRDTDTVTATGTHTNDMTFTRVGCRQNDVFRVYQHFHKLSVNDQLYTDKQLLLKLPLPLIVAAMLTDLSMQRFVSNDGNDDITGNNKIENSSENTERRHHSQRNVLFHRLQKIWMEKQKRYDFIDRGTSSSSNGKTNESHRRKQLRYYEWSPTLVLQVQSPSQSTSSVEDTRKNESIQSILVSFRRMLDDRCMNLIHQTENIRYQLLHVESEMESRGSKISKKQRLKKKQKKFKSLHRHLNSSLPQDPSLNDSITESEDEVTVDDVDDDNVELMNQCSIKNHHITAIDKSDEIIDDDAKNNILQASFQPNSSHSEDWKQVRMRRKVITNDDIVTSPTQFAYQVPNYSQTKLDEHAVTQSLVDTTTKNNCDCSSFAENDDPLDNTNSFTNNATKFDHVQFAVVTVIPTPVENTPIGNEAIQKLDTITSNIRATTGHGATCNGTKSASSPNTSVVNHDIDELEPHAPTLLKRIQQLELQLRHIQQQLAEERQMARKSLQLERDASYERIQALQLRLYISETRLQTYEEALQHHVESVQQNMATTTGTVKCTGDTATGTLESATDTCITNAPLATIPSPLIAGTQPLYARHIGTTTPSPHKI